MQKEIQKLLSKQVEGIIYVASHERLINVIPADLPIPTVVAYGFTNKPEIPSVVVKDKGGAEQLVRYLISCGHKRIGVIAGKRKVSTPSPDWKDIRVRCSKRICCTIPE